MSSNIPHVTKVMDIPVRGQFRWPATENGTLFIRWDGQTEELKKNEDEQPQVCFPIKREGDNSSIEFLGGHVEVLRVA